MHSVNDRRHYGHTVCNTIGLKAKVELHWV